MNKEVTVMSKMLSKMNLISVVQQLPKEDIETIQGYVEMIEKENEQLNALIKEYQKTLDEIMPEKMDIENNWNKLKEYLFDIRKRGFALQNLANVTKNTEPNTSILIIINKMQEREQGSDSNEQRNSC